MLRQQVRSARWNVLEEINSILSASKGPQWSSLSVIAGWGYIYVGSVRFAAVDEHGKNQVDTLQVGDIWYFPKDSEGSGPHHSRPG